MPWIDYEDVYVDLLPAQESFIFSESPNPAIVGGLGSGKTKGGISRLLRLMQDDPGVSTLYAMPTYDLLNLRAIPGFQEELEFIGMRHQLNGSKYYIYVPELDSYIYFRSYDKPQRLIAFEVGHSIVDEIDTLPIEKAAEVWRKVTERTRQKTNTCPNSIGAVASPDHGIHGFVYNRWVRQATERQELFNARTNDNPFLPDGYVEQIRENYDDKLAEIYINGGFVSLTDTKVYHFFDKDQHHKDAPAKDSYNAIHIGIDFNVGGCCSSVSLIKDKNVHAIEEFVSHDTYDFINNLNKYKGYQITIYPDATGSSRTTNASESDIQLITSAGYRIDAGKANPYIRDRVNSFNSVISKGNFSIDTNKCPQLTESLEAQGYDKGGDPEKFDKHPAIDDWNDQLTYMIHRKFPLMRPISQIQVGGR